MKRKPKTIILALIATAVLATLWLLCMKHLDFKTVQQLTQQMHATASAHIIGTFLILIILHALGMLFTLPTKAIFNLVSGALLGFVPGAIVTLLGTLVGTSGLFFLTRNMIHTKNSNKFPERLKKFKQRLQNRPTLTVASLRMILALPYGAITIFCAVAKIPYRAFVTGSFLGDTPVVLLYTAAGVKLMHLANQSEAVSLETIALLSMAGMGLFAGALWPSKKPSGAATSASAKSNSGAQ
ncbi:MAG: VTT domain-containing protein [Deltaproteobacteria bacterium]|nr:VTT domain-containing protein [Deltaproteobacteria bacterium]